MHMTDFKLSDFLMIMSIGALHCGDTCKFYTSRKDGKGWGRLGGLGTGCCAHGGCCDWL